MAVDTIITPAAKGKTNVRYLQVIWVIIREMLAPETSYEITARIRGYGRRR